MKSDYNKNYNGDRKITCFLVIFTVLLLTVCSTGSAAVLNVDDDPGADYTSIKEAVNNSSPEDTILVSPGLYIENVYVDLPGLTIKSKSGTPDDTVVQALDRNHSVFYINKSNVTISGFRIEDAGAVYFNPSEISVPGRPENFSNESNKSPSYDYYLFNSSGKFAGEEESHPSGVFLYIVDNCRIDSNKFTNNLNGISLLYSVHNNLSNNSFSDGGISMKFSTYNSLTDNFLDDTRFGISLTAHSYYNTVSNNKVSNSYEGIGIGSSSWGNSISNNTISNTGYGISIYDAGGNTVMDNVLSNSSRGIQVIDSYWETLIGNKVTESRECGICLSSSVHTFIYNNYLNNTENVKFESVYGENLWNTTKTPGNNIAGGPYLGGNYWADPNGTGFSETVGDSDGDGFCDSPYNPYGNDFDYHPLVKMPSGSGMNSRINIIDPGVSIAANRSRFDLGTFFPGRKILRKAVEKKET
ncbi:MAG: NosD domain-containing protein [Methanosarcinaceae archaeon]|nr:NosD domain-containing protein [Methanosarcinaceae archaeon]